MASTATATATASPSASRAAAPPPRRRLAGTPAGQVGGKLLGAAFSLLAVLVTGFFLFRILPGDPVRSMTRGRAMTPAQLAELRARFGLDRPLAVQFADYAADLLRLDLGTSFQYREPVAGLIAERIWPTVLLVGTATVVAAALGLWLGARGAWNPGSAGDRVNTAVALTLWSVPTFWLGLLMISVFATGVGPLPGLFPTGGMHSTGAAGGLAGLVDLAWHLVLPVTTLVAVVYAQYLMIMRSSLLDERGADYLTTARAKGLPDAAVRRRHALPNALLPTVTLVFVNLGAVLTGTILAETVFSWPGLGQLFYSAIQVPDLPLVQGMFVFFSAVVILANLAAELLYPVLDPRVRAR